VWVFDGAATFCFYIPFSGFRKITSAQKNFVMTLCCGMKGIGEMFLVFVLTKISWSFLNNKKCILKKFHGKKTFN